MSYHHFVLGKEYRIVVCSSAERMMCCCCSPSSSRSCCSSCCSSSSCCFSSVQSRHGIELALLLSGDEIAYSSAEIDRFSLVANLQALINVAADICMTLKSKKREVNSFMFWLVFSFSFPFRFCFVISLLIDQFALVASLCASITVTADICMKEEAEEFVAFPFSSRFLFLPRLHFSLLSDFSLRH